MMTMEVVLGTAAASGLGSSGIHVMVVSKVHTCAVLAVSSLVMIAETTRSMRPRSPASCHCLSPYEWRWRVERIMAPHILLLKVRPPLSTAAYW